MNGMKDGLTSVVDEVTAIPHKVRGKQKAQKRGIGGIGLLPLLPIGGGAFYAIKSGKGRALGWEMRKRSHFGGSRSTTTGP
jgi:hypothetical protein